jgi:excinuclease UvrABC nuclease subunit
VVDIADNLLYIGKAKNLRNRWKSHHRIEQFKELKDLYILWVVVDSDDLSSFES